MNIIQRIEGRFPLIRNDRIRDVLFLLGMVIIVYIETMTTTMFELNLPLYRKMKIVAVVLIAAKLVLFDSWKLKDILLFALFGVVSILVSYCSTYNDVFFWVLLMWGAMDIDFRKILKVHGTVVFLVVLAAFVASLTGKIVNLQYVGSDITRNSFGIIYPTDFAAYIFFLMTTFFYLLKDRMKWWMYASGIVLGFVVFKYCHTRLDCSCMIAISLLYMITALVSPHINGKARGLRTALCFVIVLLFFLCFFLSYYYDESVDWMKELDVLFSTRLYFGREAFNRYDVKLFGQSVLFVGNGGSTEWRADYFFIDSSYLYVLFRYGIVFTVLLLGSYVVSSYKRRDDLFFLVAVCVIAVNATTAHHLTHVQYNPFFMALLSSFGNGRQSLSSSSDSGDSV